MNFETLLKSLPQTGIEDWRKAATKQLRGEAIESINVLIANELEVEPYASHSSKQITSVGGHYGWTILSDLSALNTLHVDTVMEQLEGGAQGVFVGDGAFSLSAEELTEIRFDFLKVVVASKQTKEAIDWLSSVIPHAHRAEAEVYVSSKSEHAWQVLSSLMEQQLNGNVLIEALSPSDENRLSQLAEEIKNALVSAATENDVQVLSQHLAISWPVAADYVQTLVELRAIRLLFANCCLACGVPQPLPSLKIIGKISSEQGQTHEAYLIDASTRAVAAVSAGVEGLVISPYPDGDPTINSRRVRNMQHVLAIESGFEHVADPLQGAAFVEKCSTMLAEKVWNDLIQEG